MGWFNRNKGGKQPLKKANSKTKAKAKKAKAKKAVPAKAKSRPTTQTSKQKQAKRKNIRPHFRKGGPITENHPLYVFSQDGDRLNFIGITHAQYTDGIQNIELDENPNPHPDPKEKRKSYIRPKAERAKKTAPLGQKLTDWNFAESDKPKVKKVIKTKQGKQPKKK